MIARDQGSQMRWATIRTGFLHRSPSSEVGRIDIWEVCSQDVADYVLPMFALWMGYSDGMSGLC